MMPLFTHNYALCDNLLGGILSAQGVTLAPKPLQLCMLNMINLSLINFKYRQLSGS